MGSNVYMVDHGWEKHLKALQKLDGKEIAVGILGDSAAYQYPDAEAGFTLVDIAIVNEFGSDDGHIPERPAHRNCFEKSKAGLRKRLAGSLRLIGEGKVDPIQQLNKLGLWYVGELRQEIIDFDDPANAPYTIEKKGADNPLIDTGRMVNSIQHVVR